MSASATLPRHAAPPPRLTRPRLVVVRSLREEAYEAIKHRIITCAFRPGDYLNEASVSAMLGIGRTPVHQALDRLRLEGLVEVMPRKGVIVKPVSLDEVMQIIEARLLNEPAAARLAADRATSAELDEIDRIVARSAAFVQARDVEQLMLLDRAFHHLLAQAGRNLVLAELLGRLQDRSLRFWFIALSSASHHAEVQEEHEAIAAALRARDGDAAERAMHAHVDSFRRNVASHI